MKQQVKDVNYFLVMVPLSILFIYGIIELADFIIKRIDVHTGIDGRKYSAILIILITFPNVLVNEIVYSIFGRDIFGWGFRESILAGVVLMVAYIILAEIDDKKYKKQNILS